MISTFSIKKLDCHSCAMVIEGICEDTPGVKKAEVNSRQRKLVVEHDEQLNATQLVTTLSGEGYPVEPMSGS